MEAQLAKLDQELNGVNVPLSYPGKFYDLKMHIALVREKLGRTVKEGAARFSAQSSDQNVLAARV